MKQLIFYATLCLELMLISKNCAGTDQVNTSSKHNAIRISNLILNIKSNPKQEIDGIRSTSDTIATTNSTSIQESKSKIGITLSVLKYCALGAAVAGVNFYRKNFTDATIKIVASVKGLVRLRH